MVNFPNNIQSVLRIIVYCIYFAALSRFDSKFNINTANIHSKREFAIVILKALMLALTSGMVIGKLLNPK